MSRGSQRALRAMIVALALWLVGVSALADSIEVQLNASTKVYQSLSASARSVAVAKGLRVELKSCADGWGRVSYNGIDGYVKLKYLDRVDPLKAYVTKRATVYADASGSEKLATVKPGAVLYVLGVDGRYVRVQDRDGTKKGYIRSGVLSASKPSAGTAAGDGSSDLPESLRATAAGAKKSKVEKTIYAAQKLVGAPYASQPNPPKSFDCATFTHYCYGKAEKGALKGSSKGQGYDDSYEKIAYDDLKRGDLVCFDTVSDDDLCDHVGIYLGGGYFLHSSSAAKKVILSSLTSGYYRRTFSWGRRIFGN